MMKNLFLILLAFAIAFEFPVMAQKPTVVNLNCNSSDDDFAPVLSNGGKTMFFTSDRSRGKQRVYEIKKTEDGWTLPDDISGDVNDATQAGSATFTPDGQYMIFAGYEHDVVGEGRTDLYSARKMKGKWVDVQNLGPAVNSAYWDSQPALSSDGNTLYFVSDRPGGEGGTDIYVSKRTREGWSRPENLRSINTSANEMAPGIAYDNKSFTFASDRSGGKGGYDIYFVKGNNGSFGNPTNAGEPVNSASDDVFYFSVHNTDMAYFSSARSGGSGNLDVYTVVPNPFKTDAVVVVSGTVRDAKTQQPLGATITITDLKNNSKVATLNSDDVTGNYYVVLQPGHTYSITASRDGYLFYSERFEIPANQGYKEIPKDIYLSRSDTRLLVYFDFDKSTLKDESYSEMDRVVDFLQSHPNVEVALEGHTDDVGDPGYNEKLSAERAAAVKTYLVSKGVSASRITSKGYGSSRPLIKEKTDEARAINRRVEMKITKGEE